MTVVDNGNWRLTPELDVFIAVKPGGNVIYFAAPEKAQYKNAVSKLIDCSYKELHIEQNEFEVKVGLDTSMMFVVYVRNSALPTRDWYKVGNFSGSVCQFFTELDSSKGEFPGQVFEAVFSDSVPTGVSFSSPGMSNYKKYFEEMKRRLNCEIKKKTKKWVIGHRYDTIKETFIYLGSVVSRRSNNEESDFLSDSEVVPVHLYVNNIKDGETCIDDILKSRSFGKDEDSIKVLYSIPLASDSGAVLDNTEIEDFSRYWKGLIDNAIVKNTEVDLNGYKLIKSTKYIFDPLCYQTPGKLSYNASGSDWIGSIMDVLDTDLDNVMMYGWNIKNFRKDMCISPSNTAEDNINAIEKCIYYYTDDENLARISYYSKLMSAIGVDIRKLSELALANWNEASLCKTFDDFLKNSVYFDLRKNQTEITSRQRIDSTPYKIEVNTIESMFGDCELTDTLKNMITFARKNLGAGIKKYLIYNVGTKKQPKEYESIEVSLENIINWCGGVSEMSETLKNDIISRKFTRMFVVIDRAKEIE